jgi:uncharacterized protein
MNNDQAIINPFGIAVFGSAVAHVDPDVASLHFAVSRLAQQPTDAFKAAQEAAQHISAYLGQAHIHDVSSSNITLATSFRNKEFEGYRARVAYNVILNDLGRIEEIVAGVVASGANELHDIVFQSSRLKEIRADVRRRAVAAAREKAQIYCEAAGVILGSVIHIEDTNPDSIRGGDLTQPSRPLADTEESVHAFNPGSITIGAAVRIAFAFG